MTDELRRQRELVARLKAAKWWIAEQIPVLTQASRRLVPDLIVGHEDLDNAPGAVEIKAEGYKLRLISDALKQATDYVGATFPVAGQPAHRLHWGAIYPFEPRAEDRERSYGALAHSAMQFKVTAFLDDAEHGFCMWYPAALPIWSERYGFHRDARGFFAWET